MLPYWSQSILAARKIRKVKRPAAAETPTPLPANPFASVQLGANPFASVNLVAGAPTTANPFFASVNLVAGAHASANPFATIQLVAAPSVSAPIAALSSITAPATAPRSRCIECSFALSENSTSWPGCKAMSRELLKTPESTAAPRARNKQAISLDGMREIV